MKLIAYLRVSTDRQAERGFGLKVQERVVGQWARAHGHRIVATYRDEGVSGSNGVEDREGLPQALDDIGHRKAEGLIVARLDRVARQLTTQEAILAKVWDLGGVVVAVDMGGEVPRDDPDDPMRTAMRQMAGVFAELDRAMIAKRLRDGRRKKADQGGFAYGSPHYGVKAIDGDLVPDVAEQATLARIRELREVREDGRPLSLRKMIAILEKEGHRAKRGGRWHPQSLKAVIDRL